MGVLFKRLVSLCLVATVVVACTPPEEPERRVSGGSGPATLSSIGAADFDAPLGAVDRDAARTALVIGNGAYQSLGWLENPTNDARLMADTLQDLGFVIHSGGPMVDLDAAQMRAAVADYRASLAERGGMGAVYFAGHAVQVEGRNWLAPVDAAPRDFSDLRDQFVAADDLMQAGAAAGVDLNMVVLDACRDNPFASRGEGRSSPIDDPRLRSVSAGLSSVAAPPGTLVAFATSPGSVAFDGQGSNSPYAEALAQALREPGERIEDVFIRVRGLVAGATAGQQVPWETSSLTKQVVLGDPAAGPRRTARFDGTYIGTLKCQPSSRLWGNPVWTRPEGERMTVMIENGYGVWLKGLPEPEKFWSGGPPHRRLEFSILDNGDVRATGINTGTKEAKIGIPVDVLDFNFSGRMEDGVMRTTGLREDLPCAIELTRF